MSGPEKSTRRRKSLLQRVKEAHAINALLLNPTVEHAAAAAGVGESTLRRWLRNPKFAARVEEARRLALATTINALVGRSARALIVLDRLLDSPNESIRLRAADRWFDHMRAQVVLNQQEQIDNLARQVAALAEAQKREGGS